MSRDFGTRDDHLTDNHSGEEDIDDDDQSFIRKWFPKIVDTASAMKTARYGAYAAGVYAVMTLAGTALAYWGQTDPVTGETITPEGISDVLIGTPIVLTFVGFLAWRVWTGKGYVSASLLTLLFSYEIAMKVMGGTASIGWMVFYAAIMAAFANGVRGTLAFRKFKQQKDEANYEMTTMGE